MAAEVDEEDGDDVAPRDNPGPIDGPSPLPAALDAALMPFQRAGVAFAVRRGGRALIGDDMGLGKTIQAIATCCAFRKDWPVLIVVPNSVRLVWADELERWIPAIGPGGVNVVSSGQDLQGLKQNTASFHVMTYGLLARASSIRQYIREHMAFKMVVVDESHMIKNRTTLRTREILRIAQSAERVLLLSGTPALARPVELYTQVEAVAPKLFASYSAFTQRYCAPKVTPWGMDFNGAANLKELHQKLRRVMVRRLKVDVLKELPSKRRQRVQLEVSESNLQVCTDLKEQLLNCAEDDMGERRKCLMQMYVESAAAKKEAVCEYIEDLLAGGCKFLAFAHHISMLDAMQEVAVRSKVGFIRIDGSVNSYERQNRCSAFQTDETVRIAILGIQAAGVGITLTAASTVVFAELHWTPGVLVQAEDRAHRIGQKNSVNIHYLMAAGTIDDIIWPSVRHKVEVVTTMCDGQKSYLNVKVAPSADTAAGEVADPVAAFAMAVARDEATVPAGGEAPSGDFIDAEDLLSLTEASRGLQAKPPAGSQYSVLSMLQGRGPLKGSAKVVASRWVCTACGFRNPAGEGTAFTCGECEVVREDAPSAALPLRPPTSGSPVAKAPEAVGDDAVETASDTEGGSAMAQDASERLSFCVRRTGRVHILDPVGEPIGVNFKLGDWEAMRDAAKFPDGCCLHEVACQRVVDLFLQQWAALRATDHRNLSDQTLRVPLSRHLKRRAGAAAVRSTRRCAVKPQPNVACASGGEAGDGDNEGGAVVICAWCGKLGSTDQGAYCSRACEDKDRVRTSQAFARTLVFSVEKGVCRICGLDAHALYERVKAMTPPERYQELIRAGFSVAPRFIDRPNESLFWQADHILPVAEGGGEADLGNLRTLCTMCHAKETKSLQGRLKCAKWAGNSDDIRQSVKRKRSGTTFEEFGCILDVDELAGSESIEHPVAPSSSSVQMLILD